jgi:hypothetical protein
MPTPVFSTDQLVQALSQTIPLPAIEAALDKTGKRERRTRKLPSTLVVQLVIALGLLLDLARRQVLGSLLPPATLLPGKMCLSRACYRVGPRPLIELMHQLARPLADPVSLPQAFYQGLRLVALDGSDMDVPASPANERAFGRRKASRGQSAFPAIKLVTLIEAGTHATLDLEVRPGRRHEQLPARKIIARIPGTLKLEPEKVLADGSYLCRIQPDRASRGQGAAPLLVRVVEYRISGHGEVIRLATSLLDEKNYPALELATLYHERWEVETFLDELKTHQQGRPNGQGVAVHAQLPAGVVQEVYGLVLAHRVVRTLMSAAAASTGLDPDRLSFKNALVIVRRYLPRLAQAQPKALPPLLPKCFSRSATSAWANARRGAISAG